jgi:tetratricopeptide (TPR) repeat protein
VGDPALCAGIGTYPAFGNFFAGAGHGVLTWAARVLEHTGSDGTLGRDVAGYSPGPAMLHATTAALTFLGRLDEARTAAVTAARAAEEAGDVEVRSWVHMIVTVLAYTCGGPGSVVDEGRRCVEIGERLDNESSRMIGHLGLGHAHLADGEPEAARDAILQSIAIAREHGTQLSYVPTALALLAETYLLLGERGDALEVARETIELARESGCPYAEAMAQLTLAATLRESDARLHSDESEAAVRRAEELVESIDARSLSPRILEERARWAAATPDEAARDALLEQALELYRSIGAKGHAARLAADMAA